MPTAKSLLGRRAENIAAETLGRIGYRHVGRNFRCRYGEIDIIAWDGDCLVFVEVRSHSNTDFGSPAESISASKQTKLCLTAQVYLAQNELLDINCRFDVVEVTFEKGSRPDVRIIRNAFEAPDTP